MPKLMYLKSGGITNKDLKELRNLGYEVNEVDDDSVRAADGKYKVLVDRQIAALSKLSSSLTCETVTTLKIQFANNVMGILSEGFSK